MLQRITRRTRDIARITGSSTYFQREILLTPGTVQQFPTTAPTSSPIVGPDSRVWFNAGNALGIFDPTNLQITYIPTPATAMQEITVGPDGNVYYGSVATSLGSAGIGWANASGNLGFVVTPGWVTDVAAASDRIWFSQEQGNNAAAWLTVPAHTASYVATKFATLAPMADPQNGGAWFGEFGHKLAFVSASGALTEYDTRAVAITHPLAFDSSGNLWFGTDVSIGYVTPSGQIAHFDIGGNGAFAILFNSDGTVWFASSFSAQIGLLEPSSGTVTWFNISGLPAGLVRGSDGQPWFTEFTPKLGTITTGGQVSEFATQGAQPYPPILGSDGNVWYGDGGDGSILTKRYVGNVTPGGTVNEWQTNALPNSLIQIDDWIYFGENTDLFGRVFVGANVVR